MKMSKKSGAVLAACAAAFVMSASTALPVAAESHAANIQCSGVNACKGLGSCKGANNACKGQGSCKGTGFVEMTEEQCKQIGGKKA